MSPVRRARRYRDSRRGGLVDNAEGVRLEDIEPDDPRLLTELLPVLAELRNHLTADMLSDIYAEGHGQGLRFLAAYELDRCVGVAGWRIIHSTSTIRRLYVDDLVTTEAERSTGVGHVLLAELEARAREARCTTLELDSGVQRADAHRFYFREGMAISSFHFRKTLHPAADS